MSEIIANFGSVNKHIVMAKETERKFLVIDESWREHCGEGTRFVQTYLNTNPDATVRLRIAGSRAFITVKAATAELNVANGSTRFPSKMHGK